MTEERSFKPICIWCSAEWSDDNIRVFDLSSYGGYGGCETCGYGGSAGRVEFTIKITCHACDKLMYQKDFSQREY